MAADRRRRVGEPTGMFREYGADALLPAAWRGDGDVRIFNPTVAADGDGYILFYRVAGEQAGRRIAGCRLDRSFDVVPGSVVPFSDHLGEVPGWHADPRLFRLDGRLFVSWNDGILAAAYNQQHVVEVDPVRLTPAGAAAPITMAGKRRMIEKNWVFFEADGCRAIYSTAPHRVLACAGEPTPWHFVDRDTSFWHSAPRRRRFGEPRGGAQPVRLGDRFYHVGHAARHAADGNRYVALVCEFAARAPFRVTRFSRVALALPTGCRGGPGRSRLNAGASSVVYPAGLALVERGGAPHWLIAYGVDDEAACLALVSHAELERTLAPVVQLAGPLWQILDKLPKLPRWLRDRQARRAVRRVLQP